MVVQSKAAVATSKVARLFERQPDRVAAAWRRLRFAEGPKDVVPENLIGGVVESFVRELGATLGGAHGSPWSRTRGVLRLSPPRSLRILHEEFSALRRCLFDAADVLGGGASDRAAINAAIDEAMDSATALHDPTNAPASRTAVPFGGIIVKYFERTAATTQRVEPPTAPPTTH